MTKLDYVSGSTIIPEGAFGISPSNISKFFDRPHEWYDQQVLGNEGFTGSTASFLGTVVHYCAEEYAKTGSVDKSEIYQYLYNHLVSNKSIALPSDPEEAEQFLKDHADHPEIDCEYILDQYKIMGNELIQAISLLSIAKTEELICAEVVPGYYPSGSVDMITTDGHMHDYKTTSALTAPKSIPYGYKLQLLTYAWIYHKKGIKVRTINITWITNNQVGRTSPTTGKPIKDYPCSVTTVTHTVTPEDLDFIESLLKLIAESVQLVKEKPDLAYIVFKDYRLKQQTKLTQYKF